MPTRKINFNYLNRDYQSLKSDLMNYVKLYYPDQYNDFSKSSVGMMLLELNAYVGDILSFHVDQALGEMYLDTAQNRDSVMKIAKNLGYKQRGMAPAVTLLDVSINVPTYGDTFDDQGRSKTLVQLNEGLENAQKLVTKLDRVSAEMREASDRYKKLRTRYFKNPKDKELLDEYVKAEDAVSGLISSYLEVLDDAGSE